MLRLLPSDPDLVPLIFIARIYFIIYFLKRQELLLIVYFNVSRETLKYI